MTDDFIVIFGASIVITFLILSLLIGLINYLYEESNKKQYHQELKEKK